MKRYLVKSKSKNLKQSLNDLSFIGGQPALPKEKDIPACKLCGAEQSFFFQIAFDKGDWKGYSLAAFLCTSCAERGHLIPDMLSGSGGLHNADIPANFLDDYQINFSFLVFKTTDREIKQNYKVKVKFFPLENKKTFFHTEDHIKLGGKPIWILTDESPGMYAGTESMVFLFQIPIDYEFDIVDGAPGQIVWDYSENKRKPAERDHYKYFLANCIYFFGTENPQKQGVYVIPQCD